MPQSTMPRARLSAEEVAASAKGAAKRAKAQRYARRFLPRIKVILPEQRADALYGVAVRERLPRVPKPPHVGSCQEKASRLASLKRERAVIQRAIDQLESAA